MDRRNFLAEVVTLTGGFAFGSKAFAATPEQGVFKFRSVVCVADVVNSNKRVYPRAVLEQQVEKLKTACQSRALIGELGMSGDTIVHFTNASHIVTDLQLEGNDLVTEIELINTPAGNLLRSMMKNPNDIAFRTSGVGNGRVDENGILHIDESYRLISINAVPASDAAQF